MEDGVSDDLLQDKHLIAAVQYACDQNDKNGMSQVSYCSQLIYADPQNIIFAPIKYKKAKDFGKAIQRSPPSARHVCC